VAKIKDKDSVIRRISTDLDKEIITIQRQMRISYPTASKLFMQKIRNQKKTKKYGVGGLFDF